MKKIIKTKDLFWGILYFLVLLFCISPDFLDTFAFFNKISKIFQVLFFCISLIILIKNKKISLYVFLFLLYYIVLIVSAFMNYNDYVTVFKFFIAAFPILVLGEYLIKYNFSLFLKVTVFYFAFIITINFITIILFPNGLYSPDDGNKNKYFFLGHRNNLIEYLLPGLCFCFLYYKNFKRHNCFPLFLFILSFLSVLLTWSANSLISLTIILVYLFIPILSKKINKYIGYWQFFLLTVFLFVFIVIFRGQKLFSWLIVDILHKSLDFTSRTFLWDNALYYISKAPIFGYGFDNGVVKLLRIGHINSAHNYFLDFMYSGGILLLLTILFIVFLVGKKIYKNKRNFNNKILSAIFGAYFIIWFATPVHSNLLVMFFLVCLVSLYINEVDIHEQK